MQWLSIGELARRAELRTSALLLLRAAGSPAGSHEDQRPQALRHRHGRRRRGASLRPAGGIRAGRDQNLFRDFDRGSTLSARWRALAATKLAELNALVEKAARMRRAIETGLACGCVRIEDCALSPINRAAKTAERRRQLRKVRR